MIILGLDFIWKLTDRLKQAGASPSLLLLWTTIGAWICKLLKGQWQEIFDFRISSWISFPQALEYPIRVVAEIFAAQSAPPVSVTPVANEKNLQQKSFNYFVRTPLGRRVNTQIIFFLQVPFKMEAVWYCSNFLDAGIVDTGRKLPTLSTTPAVPVGGGTQTMELGGPVRQPYITYRPDRLHRLAESIPWNGSWVGSLNVYKFGLCIDGRQLRTISMLWKVYIKHLKWYETSGDWEMALEKRKKSLPNFS